MQTVRTGATNGRTALPELRHKPVEDLTALVALGFMLVVGIGLTLGHDRVPPPVRQPVPGVPDVPALRGVLTKTSCRSREVLGVATHSEVLTMVIGVRGFIDRHLP